MLAEVERSQEKIRGHRLRLDALNPRNVLKRGYSIVEKADRSIVNSPADAATGETLTVYSDGGSYDVERK